jgi:hypothetical protein
MQGMPSYLTFDKKNYSWLSDVDYRKNPTLYKVGKGEQGVLICEPYKSEILPYWAFKTPEIAKKSSQAIFRLFKCYLSHGEFVGADIARKYLQMGFTRAMRYYNYKGGRKYNPEDYKLFNKGTGDKKKQISATIFYEYWQKAEHNKKYKSLQELWKSKYG